MVTQVYGFEKVLITSSIKHLDAYQITKRSTLAVGFSAINLVKMEENYEKFMKKFLIPILTNGVCMGPKEVYDGSSPKVSNEGLLEIN